MIGIYNNVKIENILNSNFLLARSVEDQTAQAEFRNNDAIHKSVLISSINE